MKLTEIRKECDSQAEYLQVLCNKFGDFKIATCYPGGIWTKHYSVMECWQGTGKSKGIYSDMMWRLDIANQRQIFPNELVLDIDKDVTLNLKKSIIVLNRLHLEYEIFYTGSKGYHIHILFDHTLTKEDKAFMIEQVGADIMKKSDNTMIALEFARHWKSGKIKEVVGDAEINERG